MPASSVRTAGNTATATLFITGARPARLEWRIFEGS